jgi:hypothetical protein
MDRSVGIPKTDAPGEGVARSCAGSNGLIPDKSRYGKVERRQPFLPMAGRNTSIWHIPESNNPLGSKPNRQMEPPRACLKAAPPGEWPSPAIRPLQIFRRDSKFCLAFPRNVSDGSSCAN